jgi:hypothetical protein
VETLSLHIVVALHRWPYVDPLLLSTVIAPGKLVALSLLKVIAFVTLEELSLLLVILESLSLLKVTL